MTANCPDWCDDHYGSNPNHHHSTRRQILSGPSDEAIELQGYEHNLGIKLFENGSEIALMWLPHATAVREEYIRNAAAFLNAAAELGKAIEEVWGV